MLHISKTGKFYFVASLNTYKFNIGKHKDLKFRDIFKRHLLRFPCILSLSLKLPPCTNAKCWILQISINKYYKFVTLQNAVNRWGDPMPLNDCWHSYYDDNTWIWIRIRGKNVTLRHMKDMISILFNNEKNE